MKTIRELPPADYLRERFSYDPETGILVLRSSGKPTGSFSCGYLVTSLGIGNRLGRVNRIAWKMMTGEDAPCIVDHADHDRSNNRWNNLRLAGSHGNQQNKAGHSKSGLPKGVSRHGGGYRAKIMAERTLFNLGTFRTVEEVKAAYDKAAASVHGDFAHFV